MPQNCVKIYIHFYILCTSYKISTDKLQKHVHVVITVICIPVHVHVLNLNLFIKYQTTM